MKKKLPFLITFSFFFVNFFSQERVIANVKKEVLIAATDTLTKVTYQYNFQEKYNTHEFNYDTKQPITSFFQRFLNWLSQRIGNLFNIVDSEQTLNYASNFVKFLALVIILVAVYFIVKIILNKQGNWIFAKSSTNKIKYDAIEDNLHIIDFNKLIETTKKSGNHRLEIRYYYLWILKKLSDSETIILHHEKTNSDYCNEIISDTTKANFKYVSYLYSYIWYGEFDLTDETYESSKESFVKMLQSL